MAPKVTAFRPAECFKRDLKRAPLDVQESVRTVIEKLLTNSAAASLRCHPLSGYGRPLLYKVDVLSNHSWQITFEMDGTTAILRRLGTHKQLDRDPR